MIINILAQFTQRMKTEKIFLLIRISGLIFLLLRNISENTK